MSRIERPPDGTRGFLLSLATLVRGDLDALQPFIEHHLAMGVDRLLLYTDESPTGSLRHSQVEVVPCNESLWQDSRPCDLLERQWLVAADAFRRARSRWLAFIDDDECLFCPVPLDKALDVPWNYIQMGVLEGVPEEDEGRKIQLFRCGIPSWRLGGLRGRFERRWFRLRRRLASMLGCGALFEGRYYAGHEEGKWLVRCDAPIEQFRVHHPVPRPEARLSRAPSSRLKVLHFDGCSYTTWLSKWKRRHRTNYNWESMHRARRRQAERIYAALEAGEDMRPVYWEIHGIPRRMRPVLFLLGFLKRLSPTVNFSLHR